MLLPDAGVRFRPPRGPAVELKTAPVLCARTVALRAGEVRRSPSMGRVPELRRGQRLPDAERRKLGAELRKWYEAGRSVRQLSAETGYSIGRVRRLLIESGVTFRPRGGPHSGSK